jgi:outer membrane protein, heavy metal efflux system
MLKIKFIGVLMGMAIGLSAQMTRDQAVQLALQNHPQTRAAALEVEANRRAERAARGLTNPELNAESPTGEFYTVGVLQSFDFPTVYRERRQVAQAETQLAQTAQKMTDAELRYAVRNQFLETQVADYQMYLAQRRDSIFQKIGAAATQQFAAGDIDFLQKTVVENQSATARQARLSSQVSAGSQRTQLGMWLQQAEVGPLEPLRADTLGLTTTLLGPTASPLVAYERQSAQVAQQAAELARSSNLPNFSVGYLNQGPRTTPYDLRFRATVGVPLWVGQNRATRQSAQLAAEAANQRVSAAERAAQLEALAAQTEAVAALSQVRYFEREGLPRSRTLIDTATRLRAAGQIDYPTFLRTLDEAFFIENEYVTQLKSLNAAVIRLQFLAGQ